MANGIDRKFCRVVINAYAYPPLVSANVINPMRSHLALFLILEIVGANWLRFSLALPLPAAVLEIPHPFLFLAIHGNHRLIPLLKGLALTINVGEWCVPVRMGSTFSGLWQSLQA